MEKNNILIIGGNGFIGQYVVRESLRKGFKVYNISLNENKSFIERKNIINYYCDISEHDFVQKNILDKIPFKYIINCSGFGKHNGFWNGGVKVIKDHYLGLLNVLESINYKSIEGFVQLCTSDVYGDYIAPQKEYLREKSISPYSASKTAATHLLQMLYRTEEFPAKILRLFLPYGPGQSLNMFLPQVILGCLKDKEFPVSLGEQYRDFLYIDDLIDAIFLSLKSEKANGEVINIASGNPIKIKEMVQKVQKMIGRGKPQFGKYPYRKNENMMLYGSIEKARTILNWEPSTNINLGLSKTIEYYKKIIKG